MLKVVRAKSFRAITLHRMDTVCGSVVGTMKK